MYCGCICDYLRSDGFDRHNRRASPCCLPCIKSIVFRLLVQLLHRLQSRLVIHVLVRYTGKDYGCAIVTGILMHTFRRTTGRNACIRCIESCSINLWSYWLEIWLRCLKPSGLRLQGCPINYQSPRILPALVHHFPCCPCYMLTQTIYQDFCVTFSIGSSSFRFFS